MKYLSHSRDQDCEANAAILWPLPPQEWTIRLESNRNQITHLRLMPIGNCAHVWAASLDVAPECLADFADLLAPDEQQRAARFHFPIHRNRFIAGRGMLRTLLGSYLGVKPKTLTFGYGRNGKPVLAGALANRPLSFNVAHSEDLLLIGLSNTPAIGVDIEQVRMPPDSADLVANFFSSRECAAFQELPPEEKPAAFFNLWTRKEAWLKATGEGITHLLSQVEVSFRPGEPARFLQLPPEYADRSSWSVYELKPRSGFAGALAALGESVTLSCWRYSQC